MKILNLLKLYPILNKFTDLSIPIRTSYSIAKFLYSTEPDYKFIVNRITDLLNIYGLKDEEGNPVTNANGDYMFQPDCSEKCQQDIKDIENFEVSVPPLEIYYDDLPDVITPKELMTLMPYIVKK